MENSSALNKLAGFMVKGEFEAAIKFSTKLLAENPDFARLYGFRGLANFEIAIKSLEQTINEVTVKSMSLKSATQTEFRESTLNEIIADWSKIYNRLRNFCNDLAKAIKLNERIYLDFDETSTESFRSHWSEGFQKFLGATLEIIARHEDQKAEKYRKYFETLNSGMQKLLEKLENPPENRGIQENYLTSASIISAREKDIQAVEFEESLVDIQLADATNSGILGQSEHIVAYTLNSIIESQINADDDEELDESQVLSLTQKLLAASEVDEEEEDFINSLKPMQKSDKISTKLKPMKADVPGTYVTLTDVGIKEKNPGNLFEEHPKMLETDKFDPGETMMDISIAGASELKDEENLGASHELIQSVRKHFDNYCRTHQGHIFPNLNEKLTPQALKKRYFYVYELQFLYQARKFSWHQKIYEDENPGKTNFKLEDIDKWAYTRDRFNFASGKFAKPVTESFNLVECRNCKGKGVLPCTNCDGTGRIQCDKCEGMGAYPPKADKITSPCPQCNGSGGLNCPKCNKEGVLDCPVCGGQKHVLEYLNLEVEQKNSRKFLFHPVQYLPRNADVRRLKDHHKEIVYENEFLGLPKYSEIADVFPGDLADSVQELYAKVRKTQTEESKIKHWATKMLVYEVEVLHFEYSADVGGENSKEVYTVDFVLDNFSVYPGNDPHLNHVEGLKNRLETTLGEKNLRQSKRIMRNLSTILGKSDEIVDARNKIKKIARKEYRIALLPASIFALLIMFLIPFIFNFGESLKNIHVFAAPVVLISYGVSLILRNWLSTFAAGVFKRILLLSLISAILCIAVIVGLSEINETLVENFVNWCNNHVFNLF